MDKDSFIFQTQRLTDTYGSKAYPQTRLDVLWKTFSRCDAEAFADAVTKVIGEEQYAPMLSKLSEAVMESQSRYRQSMRGQPAHDAPLVRTPDQEAKSAELSKFCKDFIVGRFERKVSDNDAESADKLLTSWVRELRVQRGEPSLCARCTGSGYAVNVRESGNEEICRCDCAAGSSKPDFLDYGKGVRVRFLTYSEAKKSRERFS